VVCPLKTTYPIKTICHILDLTERRVRQLVTDGILPKNSERGPYPEITRCYQRGSVMIRDIVSSSGGFSTIVHAQALYIDKDHTKKKPSAIEKPKKPEVPKIDMTPKYST